MASGGMPLQASSERKADVGDGTDIVLLARSTGLGREGVGR